MTYCYDYVSDSFFVCSEVEILYGGSNIFDYEYTAAIIHDAVLASISGALILVLVIILSGFSLWLTLGGLYAITSCFVLAYFVYRAVLGRWGQSGC